MDKFSWTKAVLGGVVLCAYLGLSAANFFDPDLSNGVKAPMFALVAATALCVSLIPIMGSESVGRTPSTWPRLVHYAILTLSATSSFLAAYFWVRSAGTIEQYLWVLVIALAITAIAGLQVALYATRRMRS